jgi:hypothetical protein
MSEPRELVEHFFRHEFGRLVAVLPRSLRVRRFGVCRPDGTEPSRFGPQCRSGWTSETAAADPTEARYAKSRIVFGDFDRGAQGNVDRGDFESFPSATATTTC